MGDLLFAPPSQNPRAPWKVSDFVSVDDTVRGGSSHSAMRLVEDTEAFHGAIDFTGFLDTTTLGGAGFASQAYSHPIPGHSLDPESYSGLSLTFTPLPLQSLSSSFPGGGKGPVQSYVLNLKTEKPKRRPDGRRESQLVYEWKIDVPQKAEAKQHDALHAQASWSQFVATYRGRPVEDAPLLDPSRIQEWSVMARSDFGEQSGQFGLRLICLEAVRNELGKREASEPYPQHVAPSGTSSEYYGFALFILATVTMVVWVIWALTPDHLLRRLGIDWYPNREWAFLLPAWSLFAVLFVYAAFISLNFYRTPPLDDLSNIIDTQANIYPLSLTENEAKERHPLHGHSMVSTGKINGPFAQDIYDLPPGMVSRERHGM